MKAGETMLYQTLGRSGLEVSRVGLGCEYLEGQNYPAVRAVIDAALSQGVNLLDVFMSQPQIRSDIGRALQGRRKDVLIQGHFGAIWKDGQYGRTRELRETQRFFEDLLTRLQTDYIDIGMLHCVDTDREFDQIFAGGTADYAQKLKQQGVIRALGISTHDPAIGLRAVETGLIDVILFSVNPAYDLLPEGLGSTAPLFDQATYRQPLLGVNPVREAFYQACQRENVGVTVMKSLAAGALLDAKRSPFGMALTPIQCIHYALDRPAVDSVLAGARTPEEILESCRYEQASDEEKDYSLLLAATPQFSLRGKCMYCNHCLPCPAHINVAQVNKLLDLAESQPQLPPTVQAHYEALERHGSDCVGCHACESRCPFGVAVAENMARAVQIFGK